MTGLYSFASLGGIECGPFRLRGVGLANCLFPWARCVITSERYGLTRIASTWPQLCHRQWLRGDKDKRSYCRLFDEGNSAIDGSRKLALLTLRRRISEEIFLADPTEHTSGVVVFSGIRDYFAGMLDKHDRVRDRLFASIRAQHKRCLSVTSVPKILIHVRCGDFSLNAETESISGSLLHVRQPMSWFTHVLGQIRDRLGSCVAAAVVSDGADEELRPLLAMPHVTRCSFGSSIADLLALSTAKLLVASGSTFSMWAAYLGRMPAIWPQGQRRQALHGSRWEHEPEVGMTRLPDEVIAVTRRQLLA